MDIVRSLRGLGLGLALGAAAWPVQAQGAGMAPPPAGAPAPEGRGRMLERLAKELKLTDAQKASCKAIFARHKDGLKQKRQALQAARKAFRAALDDPGSTPDALKALNRKLADQRIDFLLENRAMRQELREQLTPEQREKAARLEGRMEGMRMAGRGAGRGMGGWGMGGWGMGGQGKGRWNKKDSCPMQPPVPPAQ